MALPGYAGKILRVDLTNERLWTEDIEEETARTWIGSAGLGAKILYDEVPPGVEWNDPENRLIIGSGPLGGTRVVGSGTISVITKGPMTNGAAVTQANGYMAAYMKFSGVDAVVIQGRASRWLYLYLHDGQAELREASHLLGKDTWETQDIITQELGARESAMSVFSVGPSGENLCFLAGVGGDKGHMAGHNGTGAVMGFKRLKAVAASRSGGRVSVANARQLTEKARELYAKTKGSEGMLAQIATIGTLFPHAMIEEMGILPIKNYETNVFPVREGIAEFGVEFIRGNFEPKRHPCWACQSQHCHLLTIPRGPWKGMVVEEPEYEGLAAWGGLTGNTDVAAAVFLATEVDKLGFDTNGAGWAVSLAMECYEKGIITKADTGGLDLTWGNAEAVRELLHMMARREGFGDVLADGAAYAARRIGGEAVNMAIHTVKGSAPRGHDHRTMVSEMLDTATSSTGTVEVWGWEGANELGLAPPENPFDPEAVSTLNAKMNGRQHFFDSLGVCSFTALSLELTTECVNAATGWNINVDDAMAQGRRIVNLLRAFNLRHGLTADLDAPSPRYGSTPVDGPAAGIGMAQHWDLMRSNFYGQMGWDQDTGEPLPETLRALGLESVINDVWEVEPAR